MSLAEVATELVVAGLLMLAALLFPAWYSNQLNLPGGLTAETLVLILAASLVVGVVVDRTADSTLAQWERRARVAFAWETTGSLQRPRIVDFLGQTPPRDVFPEEWMRHLVLTEHEGVQKWMDQLRVRLRIARTVAVLAPACTVSVLLVLRPATLPQAGTVPEDPSFVLFLPGLHLGLLILCASLDDAFRRRPQTAHSTEPTRTDSWSWLAVSPASLWFGAQLVTGLYLLRGATHPATSVFLAGVVLSFGGVSTWMRLQRSFMAYLWNTCRFENKRGLIEACTGSVGSAADAPSTQQQKGVP